MHVTIWRLSFRLLNAIPLTYWVIVYRALSSQVNYAVGQCIIMLRTVPVRRHLRLCGLSKVKRRSLIT